MRPGRRAPCPAVLAVTMVLVASLSAARGAAQAAPTVRPPNVVVILADDLGYGDLGSYGHPTIRTPHLDRMAAEGVRFTQFYSAAPLCTPSRAGLLTGRLPVRSGMASERYGVLYPSSSGGLPRSEVTLAEALRERGYATAAIGKWHLGHLPEHLPARHGFDEYFGIPYSNDMTTPAPDDEYPPLPLVRGTEVIEQPTDQVTLTRRYTEEAVGFIRRERERPFFLYLAHTFPHVPLYASEAFRGRSPRGLYGDVVEELDWSVGEVLKTLREAGLAERTLVIFTSDNGPWLLKNLEGGSAGLLRDGKRSTWEGGTRVPGIAWWPGTVPAGRVSGALATALDLFPTAVALAGGTVPADREMDGVSLLPVLRGERAEVRELVFYYHHTRPFAVRKGPWKAHFATHSGYGREAPLERDPPELYHLDRDPSERFAVTNEPEVVADLTRELERHRRSVKPGESQLERRITD